MKPLKICKTCSNEFAGRGKSFCSKKCYTDNVEIKELRSLQMKGKKQTPETIAKRISNTNQTLKEAKRRKTCIEKFGEANPFNLEAVREICRIKSIGRKNPRQLGHQQKIIDAKIKNGTLKHKPEAGKKISIALKEYYQGTNPTSNIPHKGR